MKSSKSAKHNGQSDVFTSFPNFFLSYKSLPSCRWHADLEIILSQIDLEIILSQIDQVQNIYCEKFAGEMAIFCKCRKYTKLQEWKTQETFQREKFHVSESIPVQQSLSPEMQIFFFSFVWYVCFFGWILAFLGTYKYKCMFWVVFKGTHLVYFVQKFFPSHQELCLRLARVSEEDWDWQDWALKMQVFEDDSRRF